jgi:hypothetical protein
MEGMDYVRMLRRIIRSRATATSNFLAHENVTGHLCHLGRDAQKSRESKEASFGAASSVIFESTSRNRFSRLAFDQATPKIFKSTQDL